MIRLEFCERFEAVQACTAWLDLTNSYSLARIRPCLGRQMKANTVCFSSSSATKEPRLSSFWPTMRNQIAIWFSHDVCYLWRALDQHGHVLNIPVQRRRDKKTAKKFFQKLPKGLT